MPRQKPGKSKQNYATPSVFIADVEHRFGYLEVDLAATRFNKKAPIYYTPQKNSLAQTWVETKADRAKRFWLNPPYAHLWPWLRKCNREQFALSSGQILVLVPASVGSTWFEKYVWRKASIYFLEGRLCFVDDEPYPKDLMLLCYQAPRLPVTISIWDWKADILYKQ